MAVDAAAMGTVTESPELRLRAEKRYPCGADSKAAAEDDELDDEEAHDAATAAPHRSERHRGHSVRVGGSAHQAHPNEY